MLIKQSRDNPSPALFRQVFWRLFPNTVLVFLSILFAYRSGVIHWNEETTGSQLDMLLLGICLLLLLAVYVEGTWRLVRAASAEKIMRTSLAQSEARLKSLFQTIPDLIWLKDVQGIYLACNPAFERLYGKKEGEIIGRTDDDFVAPELAEFFRENDRAALASGGARKNEEWLTFADDGQSFLFETIKIPVKTPDGELVGVMGIARDITRRHEAERDAGFFRTLVEFSGDPIYVLDRSSGFRMVFANQAACRHFGVSREQILAWRVSDWNPDVRESDLEEIDTTIRRQGSMLFETRHRASNGEIVPVEVSANRLIVDDRELSAGYIRDISERKRAEASLNESQEKLRQLLAHQDRARKRIRKRIAREMHDELAQHLLALRIDVSLIPQMAPDNSLIDDRVNGISGKS